MIGQFRRHLSVLFRAILSITLCGIAAGGLDHEQLRDVAVHRYGEQGLRAAADWLRLIDRARDQPITVQLGRINEFFNSRTRFVSDLDAWQQTDYWATPLDTLARELGDCEDFAIAKYVSLMALGVPQNRLRLIYVRARLGDAIPAASQAHMVLGYYADPNGEPQILDNLVGSVERASARPDLTPVFSFNGEGLWAGGVKARSDPTARLSRWRDLLARLRKEGFQ